MFSPNSQAHSRPSASKANPSMLRWPYDQVRLPNGLPAEALPLRSTRSTLPPSDPFFCDSGGLPASPVATRSWPSRSNRSRPPWWRPPTGMPVRIGLMSPSRSPSSLMRTTRSSAEVVTNAYTRVSSSGSRARPSRPPSPPGEPTDPRTSPSVVTLPLVSMRTIEPSSRWATRASPLGRKAMPHGTLRPSATVPATRGFSSSSLVRVGDGDGDRPGRAGSSSLHPISVTAPSPATPERNVRRSTMHRSCPLPTSRACRWNVERRHTVIHRYAIFPDERPS